MEKSARTAGLGHPVDMKGAIKPWALPLTALALLLSVLPASATPTDQTCIDGSVDCHLVGVSDAAREAGEAAATTEAQAEPAAQSRAVLTARDRSPHHFASKSYNRWYAQLYIKRVYDWDNYHWKCLDRLWQLESGWNELAKNRRSGAYGIPQALPGNKMAAMGRNWKKNPEVQIKWGASYIKSRYKSPCKALAFMDRRGWY